MEEILPSNCSHGVYFYGAKQFPVGPIADFLHAGLVPGESAVVIATAEHLQDLESAMRDRGHDIRSLRRRGLWLTLDTAVAVRALHSQTPIDQVMDALIGATIREASSKSPSGRVRLYGELVDVLCREGNIAAVLALEVLSNILVRERPIRIFCGYCADSFPDAGHARPFSQVCNLHDKILSNLTDTADWRLHMMSVLAKDKRQQPS